MGLDIIIKNKDGQIKNEIFSGAYSAFNRLRLQIIESIGGEWGWENFYWRTDHQASEKYNSEKTPGLYEFFTHSDCDGEITWENAGLLAKELKDIMPLIEQYEKDHVAMGHLARLGLVGTVQKMIDGLQEAYELKETVLFR